MEKEEFENYCKSGKIGNEVREYAKKIIKKGMLLKELADKIEGKIIDLGGKIAFPVNLSINEIAAHYTPSIDDTNIAEGLLKVDLGVEVEGYIADLAFSIDLTEKREYSEMIKLNEQILKETLKSLSYESKVCDVGNKMGELLAKSNFSIIKNLTGHSLGQYDIHSELSIPNIKNQNKTALKEKAIAIEPFLTTGMGEVINGKSSEIYILISEKNVRNPETRSLLKFIKENYKTKPFCKRWLDKQGLKTSFGLNVLVKEGILHNFPVLIEKNKGIVSQFEETVVFFNGKKEITSLL